MHIEKHIEGELSSLLKQILHELRAIRQLLERQSPVQTKQPVIAQLTQLVYTPQKAEAYLERYLASRQLHIVEAAQLTPENPVMRERTHLAYFMGQNYPIVQDLLQQLRATLQRPTKVRLNLSGCSSDDISILTNVGSRLYHLYMLQDYEYTRNPRSICCKVRRQPFVHNYLSGGWFELYVAQETQKQLGNRLLWAKRNVKLLAQGGAMCEADLLMVVQSKRGELLLVVLECKSANALYDSEPRQIQRLNSLLNLGMHCSAVVFPKQPSPAFADKWFKETGSQIIGREQLPRFLFTL
ncbi:MAG: hypothetical protein ACK4ME_04005 [Fimbriimonadales bacterium]